MLFPTSGLPVTQKQRQSIYQASVKRFVLHIATNPELVGVPQRCWPFVEPFLGQTVFRRSDRKKGDSARWRCTVKTISGLSNVQTGLVHASSGESTCAPNDNDLQFPLGNSH